MAALHAARGGCHVSLLERKKTAGSPVRCGEGIGIKGILRNVELDQTWIRNRIKQIRMVSPGGTEVDIVSKDEGLILDREKMDRDLVCRARQAGVEYRNRAAVLKVEETDNNVYVCTTGSGDTYRGRCVILADGVESKLARDLGWKTDLALHDLNTCAFLRVEDCDVAQDTVVFYLGKEVAEGGYAWVFPRGNRSANVGLGILGTASGPGRAREFLERFVERHVPKAVTRDLHCGGVPVGPWVKPLVSGGAMVVGDAARQVNCISGGGLSFALYAGRTAGTVAAKAFAGGRCRRERLREYERAWVKRFGKQQHRSHALKQMAITYDDRFLDEIASVAP
jgi:digeranylgeranylglycerophospholipid reductase